MLEFIFLLLWHHPPQYSGATCSMVLSNCSGDHEVPTIKPSFPISKSMHSSPLYQSLSTNHELFSYGGERGQRTFLPYPVVLRGYIFLALYSEVTTSSIQETKYSARDSKHGHSHHSRKQELTSVLTSVLSQAFYLSAFHLILLFCLVYFFARLIPTFKPKVSHIQGNALPLQKHPFPYLLIWFLLFFFF